MAGSPPMYDHNFTDFFIRLKTLVFGSSKNERAYCLQPFWTNNLFRKTIFNKKSCQLYVALFPDWCNWLITFSVSVLIKRPQQHIIFPLLTRYSKQLACILQSHETSVINWFGSAQRHKTHTEFDMSFSRKQRWKIKGL